jgi:hypothetical protein
MQWFHFKPLLWGGWSGFVLSLLPVAAVHEKLGSGPAWGWGVGAAGSSLICPRTAGSSFYLEMSGCLLPASPRLC